MGSVLIINEQVNIHLYLGWICFGGKGNWENILLPWGCLDTHENLVKLKINFSWL